MDTKHAPEEQTEVTPEVFEKKRALSMLERIEQLGGPKKAQIEQLKMTVPGGRLRGFSPDNRRFFLVRGIGGLELADLQKNIPQNAANPEKEVEIAASVLCTLWTNSTQTTKLDELGLRTGTAGLPSSISTLVMSLSDFVEPAEFQVCSVEL